MPESRWLLQAAQTNLSQVVDMAVAGEPQHITRRGKPAVVVLSEAAFDAYRRNARAATPGFVAHLLAMPKSDQSIEPLPAKFRDVDRFAHG